jgi:hypothetical protein
MENSKRIRRIQKKLDELQKIFHFFSNGSKDYDRDFKEITNLIEELGLEKKKDHAELIQKLKEEGRINDGNI